MATTTRKRNTTTTTTTTQAPTGTTTTTVQGTPQAQVPALAHLLAQVPGVALAQPTAAWPGWGKAVRVQGNGWAGAVYVNRSNLDLRCTPAVAAQVAATVPGATVRGPQGQYVRLPYTATGTPQA